MSDTASTYGLGSLVDINSLVYRFRVWLCAAAVALRARDWNDRQFNALIG
jgi:hypothetical protein